MTGRQVALLEGAGKIALDRSPMENIGRPKRLPPVLGRNGTKRWLLCVGNDCSEAASTNRVTVEGKPDAMRSRKTVTAWSQDRDTGRCQVKGSHLMS